LGFALGSILGYNVGVFSSARQKYWKVALWQSIPRSFQAIKNEQEGSEHMSPVRLKRKALEFARNEKYAILTTRDDKRLANRMIGNLLVKEDENENQPLVYFSTNKLSRKFTQLIADPSATITFSNNEECSCISFQGTAERVPHPRSAEIGWDESLRVHYPDSESPGPEGRFSLWVLKPSRITVVNFKQNIINDKVTWMPPEIEKCADGSWSYVKR
jgi:general stress protein 26